jgi:hypothetical protein
VRWTGIGEALRVSWDARSVKVVSVFVVRILAGRDEVRRWCREDVGDGDLGVSIVDVKNMNRLVYGMVWDVRSRVILELERQRIGMKVETVDEPRGLSSIREISTSGHIKTSC